MPYSSAEGLGKPFLSPYLQAVDSNFTHGANFASSGATAKNTRSYISPFNLQIQVNQYKVFKDQVALTLEQKGILIYHLYLRGHLGPVN